MNKIKALIKKINEFSAIAKQRALTIQEQNEREEVRSEYRKLFKAGFEQKL